MSVYLGDETRMQLAAQRGYDTVIDVFDGTSGVIGRVMRTKAVAFVPDVSADPDYRIASGIVQAELCAPMLVDGRLVGIVNVEDGAGHGLDESDVGTMTLVADRLASALALAGERERLAARAELFRRLTSFATAVNGTLDPDRLNQAIVERILEVVEADSVGLTILDRATSQYVVRAVTGPDKQYVGLPVEAGTGLAGRAIRDRAMVIDDRFEPGRRPILAEPMPRPSRCPAPRCR